MSRLKVGSFLFSLILTGTEINGHAIKECGFVNQCLAAKVRVGSTIQIPNKKFNKSSNTADCRQRPHQTPTRHFYVPGVLFCREAITHIGKERQCSLKCLAAAY